jgi:hypothetical protein
LSLSVLFPRFSHIHFIHPFLHFFFSFFQSPVMTSFFPFFLSFSLSSLSLLCLYLSYFCNFSLLMSVWTCGVQLWSPDVFFEWLAFVVYSVLRPWFKSWPTSTICVVLSVVAFKFSGSQTRSPWLPSTSLAIQCPLIILLLDASNLRYGSASLNKPHINPLALEMEFK